MRQRMIPLLSATAISLAALSGAAWAEETKTQTMGETGVEAKAGQVEAEGNANATAGVTAEPGDRNMVPGGDNEERETPSEGADADASGGTAVEGDTAVTTESEAGKVRGEGESENETGAAASVAQDTDKVPGSETKSDPDTDS